MARAATKSALSDGLSISPARLRNAIMHCTAIQQPLMIWGQPGIGKSDIVADAARAAGRPLIDIRLPLMEPTDMRGIPYLADIKVTNARGEVMRDDTGVPVMQKEFRWSPPSDLPTDEMSNALIFFDEISAAPPSVQAATYQITLNRRIGTYRLPENTVMVAAGNRVRDKGVAYNMPTPLANRFTHVTLEANMDDWKDWAIANKVNQDVVGYLSFQPHDLNNFNPSQDGYAFATPRTWSFVSRLINDSSKLDARTLSDLVRGTVGDAAGMKFITYRKHTSSLPSARDILEGRVKKLKDPKPDIMYALIVALCYDLFNGFAKAKTAQTQGDREAIKTWHQQDVDTFLRFIMDNLPAELCVFAGKTLLTNESGVVISQQFLKNWLSFTNEFLELMPNKS